jgi:subtilisin family serine protease
VTHRHDHRRRLSRRPVAAALALLTATTMATAPPASAQPRSDANPARASVKTGGSTTVSITLVTGDTVRYTTNADGRVSATVDLAPGRGHVTYNVHTGENGHYYALPSDAGPALAAGVLDKQLFDLTYLAENAYADSETGELPVIVRYKQDVSAAGLAAKAKTLDGTGKARGLDSINAAAVPVAKKDAELFWADITNPRAGLAKVWLDQKVETLDDVSNEQIGAPTAWQAGLTGDGVTVAIIDTGIDETHPDLAGLAVAEENFVAAGRPGGGTPGDARDGHGHGSHVASIIAGSGAASDGRYKGVAPSTDLFIAKALDDNGDGYDSEIIAAMEWAAASKHAKIVSMSLGGNPTDGKDPLSQAVNDLTAQHGTLFVIAAGNSGPGAGTVATPGTADAALTVGAVDANDQLADFSSRGPRVGDYGIKPEISAPGVSIVAARASGTTMGSPLNDRYTAASGTSMATPHVAAAAAIMAQQHPDWTHDQLKTALIGSSASTGGTVFEYGAGRLDIGRGVTQQVTVDTPSVSEMFDYPYTDQTTTRKVTYRNTGTAPVDLRLDVAMTADNGDPAPGFATVDQDTLTVPAGGTASATLTLEPTAARTGVFSGLLRATSATGDQVTVPVGARLGAKMATLTVRLLSRPGEPIFPSGISGVGALLINDDDPKLEGAPLSYESWAWRQIEGTDNYELSMQVADGGVFHVETQAGDDGGRSQGNLAADNQNNLLTDPEVEVNGDTTLTFDLAKTVPIEFNTQRPSHPVVANLSAGRVTGSGRLGNGAYLFGYGSAVADGIRMLPTKPVDIGKFWFSASLIQIAPQVSLELSGPGKTTTLYPYYSEENYASSLHPQMPAFETDRNLRLVSADVLKSGGDVRGALVYLPAALQDEVIATVRAAMAGGAAGVVTGSYLVGIPFIIYDEMTIPVLFVDQADGDRLAASLVRGAKPKVTVRSQLEAPYEYKLNYYFDNGVPKSLTKNLRDSELARMRTSYHADYPAVEGKHRPLADTGEVDHSYNPWQFMSIKFDHNFVGRTERDEYFTVTGPDVVSQRQYDFTDLAVGNASTRMVFADRAFTKPVTGEEAWNEVAIPGTSQLGPGIRPEIHRGRAMPCDSCRVGDILRFRSLDDIGFGQYTDAGDPSHLSDDGRMGNEDTHLYRLDGAGKATEITPSIDPYQLPFYTLPESSATYRATSSYRATSPSVRHGTQIDTTWTFRSKRPASSTVVAPYTCLEEVLYGNTDPCAWVPMLMPNYDLGLSVNNTAPAGRHEITVNAQSGVGKRAALAGVKLWISRNGGKTWTQTSVSRTAGNSFTAKFTNPRPADATNGKISVKLQAWDADGNRVEQVLRDAYGLTNR